LTALPDQERVNSEFFERRRAEYPGSEQERKDNEQIRRAKLIPRPAVIVGDENFPATEDGMALAFAAAHAGELVFDHQAGAWYRWTGDRWRREESQLAFAWARDLVREFNARAEERSLTRVIVARNVEFAARADRKLAVTRDVWDRDDALLCVPGGIVDLATGAMTAPDPGQMMSRQTRVAPAPPGTGCPLLWLDFLRETTGDDAELMKFLQRMSGLCLTGDVSLELLFFIFGPGGNGKGVFIRTLANILGDYAASAAISTFTAQRNSVHLTELARLHGARLVTASETERGHRWAESRIKELTGNERPIVANFMRQDHFEFWPKFKLVIVGNFRPALAAVTPAIARRLRMIPFTHAPERPDPELKARLEAEYPAILRWMLDGLAELRAQGLNAPAVVSEATAAYLADEDRIGRWIEDRCNRIRGFRCTPSTLFHSFSDWCKDQGEEPGTQKSFTDDMDRQGFRRGRANGKRFIEGLMVVAEDTPHWSEAR
jgi:putative DNA primase/helicase